LQMDLNSLKRMKIQFSALGSQFSATASVAFDFFLPGLGKWLFTFLLLEVYPPSPRSIGINDLPPKRDLIYGLQQLTGKILGTKELALHRASNKSDSRTASANMIGYWGCGWQGQMSHASRILSWARERWRPRVFLTAAKGSGQSARSIHALCAGVPHGLSETVRRFAPRTAEAAVPTRAFHMGTPHGPGPLSTGYNPAWRACANRSRPPLLRSPSSAS
jgi:hypothetical protein